MSLVRYLGVLLFTAAIGLGSCRAGKLDEVERPGMKGIERYDGSGEKIEDLGYIDNRFDSSGEVGAPSLYSER